MELHFRTLRANEIDCRVGSVKQNGLTLLLYKDARADMDLLDETVGPDNWQRQHEVINGNLFCNVGIWKQRGDYGEWVWKQDVGVESNTEKEKGQASDAFKRACVNWGLGRELYTAPFIWIPAKLCEIKENGKDNRGNTRYACYDGFRVTAIDYNDDREIVSLEIINVKTGNVVYTYGTAARHEEPKQEEQTWTCFDCGNQIEAATFPDGKTYTAKNIAAGSYKQYGVTLCANCYTNRRAADADQS